MSARSAVLAHYEDARPIRIRIGATTRTVTGGQYARLIAVLDEGAADLRGVTTLRQTRPLNTVTVEHRSLSARRLWEVADVVVPGLIWIIGLLFAAGAFSI